MYFHRIALFISAPNLWRQVACLLFAATVLQTGCTPKLSSDPHPIYVGTGLYLDRSLFNNSRRTAIMESAANAGIAWSREEFHWDSIEPERGRYDARVLAEYDVMVNGLRKRGIAILGLLAYRVPWSSGDAAPVSDAEREDYARFAAAMAERYRGRVDHWEIWNEPNLDRFWPPAPDPDAYAGLVVAAAAAIRQANPEAKVFCGSTSGTDVDYLERVVLSAGALAFDGITFHPYSGDTPWDRSDEPMDLLRLQVMLDKYDVQVPLWVTEIGYPTSTTGNGVEESTQAALLMRAYLSLYAAGVENVFSYDWVDDGEAPDDNELHFGVLRHDLTPKPAWQAFQTLSALLDGAWYLERIDMGTVVLLHFAQDDDRHVWALWDGAIDVKDRQLQRPRGRTARIPADAETPECYSMDGAPHAWEQRDGEWVVEVSGAPCYLTYTTEFAN